MVIIFEIIKVKSDDRLIFCYVNCYIYQLPVSISSVILHEERKPKNNSSGENICGTIRSTKIFYMKIKKFLYAGNRRECRYRQRESEPWIWKVP